MAQWLEIYYKAAKQKWFFAYTLVVLVARPVASCLVIVTAAAAAAAPGPPSETPAGPQNQTQTDGPHPESRTARTDQTPPRAVAVALHERARARRSSHTRTTGRSGHAEAARHTTRPPPKLRSPPSEHFVLVAASGAR